MQEDELVAVKWMPLEEYAAIPFTQSRPLLRQIMQKCIDYSEGRYSGLLGRKLGMGGERLDLLLFGETEELGGKERASGDAWIGVEGQ